MNFLVHHTPASESAPDTNEAALRILALLQLALDKPLPEPAKDADPWIKKMNMHLRLIELGSQMALNVAYQEITGKLPPAKYRVEATPEMLAMQR